MLVISDANRLPTTDDASLKSALQAYLAGLATAAMLIVGSTVLTSFGLAIVFG